LARRDPEVVIAGLGVAGSTLAYFAAMRGFDVEAYDPAISYRKACGDAVTIRELTARLVKETGSEVGSVKSYMIAVNGRVVSEFSFKGPVWLIVDKHRLVQGLRSMAMAEGARFTWGAWSGARGHVTVDARGPYARSYRFSVLLYRVIAPGGWDSSTALLDFNVRERGVYWVFPSHDGMVNIGAGFEGIRDARVVESRLRSYFARVVGGTLEPVDRRGAPCSYSPRSGSTRTVCSRWARRAASF
jgi:flavin-dependent dehydrogenase